MGGGMPLKRAPRHYFHPCSCRRRPKPCNFGRLYKVPRASQSIFHPSRKAQAVRLAAYSFGVSQSAPVRPTMMVAVAICCILVLLAVFIIIIIAVGQSIGEPRSWSPARLPPESTRLVREMKLLTRFGMARTCQCLVFESLLRIIAFRNWDTPHRRNGNQPCDWILYIDVKNQIVVYVLNITNIVA